jgi:hypothetical protein
MAQVANNYYRRAVLGPVAGLGQKFDKPTILPSLETSHIIICRKGYGWINERMILI